MAKIPDYLKEMIRYAGVCTQHAWMGTEPPKPWHYEKDPLPMDEQKYFDELKARLHKEKATAKGLTVEQYDKGQTMAPSKPKWDVDQILADAHRVKGEYEHDRRKYRHSMLHDGTMRVPAALVVEMLGKPTITYPIQCGETIEGRDITYWSKRCYQQEEEGDRLYEEIATLKAQLAILEKPGSAVVRDISPEERAVIEAVRHRNVVNWARSWADKHEPTEGYIPLYRAILALHEAGEKNVVTVHPTTKGTNGYFSDAEKDHAGPGNGVECGECMRNHVIRWRYAGHCPGCGRYHQTSSGTGSKMDSLSISCHSCTETVTMVPVDLR